LSLVLRAVAIVPPHFREHELTLAVVGLHALARRFERDVPDDYGVISDFNPLGLAYPDAVRLAGEFRVPVAGGIWRGAVMARAARHAADIDGENVRRWLRARGGRRRAFFKCHCEIGRGYGGRAARKNLGTHLSPQR
jgi:hypothetical protein